MMESDEGFEELIEERRRAWGSGGGEGFDPLPAGRVGRMFDSPPLDLLEDTVPLSPYRPERL